MSYLDSIRQALSFSGFGLCAIVLSAFSIVYLSIKDFKKYFNIIFLVIGYFIIAIIPPFYNLFIGHFGVEKFSKLFLAIPLIVLLPLCFLNIFSERKGKGFNIFFFISIAVTLIAAAGININVFRIRGLNPYARLDKGEDGILKIASTDDISNFLPNDAVFMKCNTKDDGYIFDTVKDNFDYLMIDRSSNLVDSIQYYGFSYVKDIGDERVFKYTDPFNNMWKVTQYASVTGNQAMIYSITDLKGNLYLIDGGWDEDAPQVRKIIEENGGKVTAWFLTHPHTDHINAFTTIMESDDIPEIGAVYASEFDPVKYQEEAEDWDVYSDFERFYNVMHKNKENEALLHYIHAGETVDLPDFYVDCLHDYTTKNGGDAANDGSLMLKFQVPNENQIASVHITYFTGRAPADVELPAHDSMLFTGDLGESQSKTIMDHYRNMLNSTYLQVSHHGNGGLSTDLYYWVMADKVFFDAPDWLFNPAADSSYDTEKNKKYFEMKGNVIYSYSTAPNSVVMR